MTAPDQPWALSGEGALAPGLHLFQLTRPVQTQARPVRGVPLFVGVGRLAGAAPRHGPPALGVDRWEQFEASFVTPVGGFLEDAVRGFFANDGQRCRVLVLEQDAPRGGLASPFDVGGPAEDVPDIDLVCVPDAVGSLSGAPAHEVQAAVIRHCEAMGDRFAILDVPATHGLAAADALRARRLLPKSAFAALYAPAIHAEVPLSRHHAEAMRLVPACGHVAGVYARSDARTGVHKAPANELVASAVALAGDYGEAEHALLNQAGVNCIRSVPGRRHPGHGRAHAEPAQGLGARARRPAVRRARALVEDPHGRCRLRAEHAAAVAAGAASHRGLLRRAVARRRACRRHLRRGVLREMRRRDQHAGSRDAGRLVAEVGLAPSVPAEFVVVRITQDASGIALTGT
jgi:hypothetical protein